jgi:hypothetical protein
MEMLNWPAGVVGDPARTSNMVGVVEVIQQFHDFMWIDVAKIVKWEKWGHGDVWI